MLAPDGLENPPEGYQWFPLDLRTGDDRQGLIVREAGGNDGTEKAAREFILVKLDPQNLTERDLLSVEKTQDERERPAILFRWKPDAADRMEALTKSHLPVLRGDRSVNSRMAIMLNGIVVSAPIINSIIRDAGIIEFGAKANEREVDEVIEQLTGSIDSEETR